MSAVKTKLAAPGAGLPRLETLLLRRVALPLQRVTTSWEDAGELFRAEADLIVAAARQLDHDSLHRPVLIRRVMGIEDSSRHWSVAMTMEHLITVGSGIADVIGAIRAGVTSIPPIDIAAYKPGGSPGAGSIEAFDAFVSRYLDATGEVVRSSIRLPHPWFGPLSAHTWHCLAAAHQRIHRRQVDRIAAGL